MLKVTGQNLGLAIGQYLERELVPKATGLQKVMLYMTMTVISAQSQALVEKYTPILSVLGALSDDGMIDLDVLYPQLKDAVHKAGKIPVLGIIFDESDVDKLYASAKQLAQ